MREQITLDFLSIPLRRSGQFRDCVCGRLVDNSLPRDDSWVLKHKLINFAFPNEVSWVHPGPCIDNAPSILQS